jgi:hypothetical protein
MSARCRRSATVDASGLLFTYAKLTILMRDATTYLSNRSHRRRITRNDHISR